MTVKEDENILGTRIKLQMKRMGLTNNMLADKLGVDKSTISNWTSGYRNPKLETLMKLADTLNTSMDYLNGVTKDYHPRAEKIDLRDILKNQNVNFGEIEMTREQREAAVQIFDIIKSFEKKGVTHN